MSDITLEKRRLRKQLAAVRRSISPEELMDASDEIAKQVIALGEWSAAREVLCYIGVKPGEITTWGLLEEALAGSKRVLAPKLDSSGSMGWATYEGRDALVEAAFGLLEPAGEICEAAGGALVIVPGLAFTESGKRLGFGGGYFDRFLARHGGVSVGICHDAQVVTSLPVAAHDVAVDIVVTPTRIMRTRG